jgi:DNA-binding response OmpR family regulator
MHIVLVEDNKVLATSITNVLKHEGYSVTHFDNGAIAHHWLVDNSSVYDLVILDVLLPEMNGFEICRALRTKKIKTPVLILTSKGSLEDTVEGLDCGGDDYLKKPFIFEELLARIRSLLRRQPNLLNIQMELTPDVTVDFQAHKVFRLKKEVHLTAKEFGILTYFLNNLNKVLTQQELYDHVFDFAEIQLSNTIEVHIKNLRRKLRTKEYELPIITVRNAGYRFEYDK